MFGLISNRNMPRQVLLFRQHPGHRMYYVEIRGYRWCIGVTIYTRQVESDSWWHTQPHLVSSILLVSEIINSTQAVTNLLVHGHMFTSIRGTVTLYSLVSFAQTCHKGLDYTLIIFCMHRHNLLVSLWRICIVLSINIVCSFVLDVNKAHWELDRWCFIPLLEAFPLQMVAGYGNTDHNTLNGMHLLRQ